MSDLDRSKDLVDIFEHVSQGVYIEEWRDAESELYGRAETNGRVQTGRARPAAAIESSTESAGRCSCVVSE
jgi:hypothetical protein